MHETAKTDGIASGYISYAFIALAAVGAVTLSAPAVHSQEASAGNLGAAIRESDHACAHVIEAQQTSTSPATYQVRCNSGTFTVTINDDGSAEVTPAD